MSKSTLTRRALIAGTAGLPAAAVLSLSAAAIASAVAVPSPNADRNAATLARFEQMLTELRTRVVCVGWTGVGVDEVAAQRTLRYFQRVASGAIKDEDEEDILGFQEANEFINTHGQSLDWIYDGETFGMICSLAARSPRAAAISDPIFAAIEAHRCAEAEFIKANEAPSHIVGKYRPARVYIGDHAGGEFLKSETDERGGYTLTWRPDGKKSPLYAYSPADIERNIPRDLQGIDRDAWVAQRLAELDKDEKRIAKQHARTKLGKLEAIRDQAYDRERDRMRDLIWTVPTTLNGLAALLRYCRENIEQEEALEWTIECAVCAFAGLPAPPMNDVVASLRQEAEEEAA